MEFNEMLKKAQETPPDSAVLETVNEDHIFGTETAQQVFTSPPPDMPANSPVNSIAGQPAQQQEVSVPAW